MEALCTAEYPEVKETRSGPALTQTALLSKTFVAYFEALVAAAPYCKTTDARNKLEDRFQKALRELSMHDDMLLDKYIARKRMAWYTKFSPKQPIRESAEAAPTMTGRAGLVGTCRGILMNPIRH